MPTARPMIPSSERLVSNTRSAPKLLLQPLGHEVHAALPADVLAEHHELRIRRELCSPACGAPPRRGARRRPPSAGIVGAAERGALRRRRARRTRSTSPSRGSSAYTKRFTSAGSGAGRARAAWQRRLDVARDLGLERLPLRLAHERRHEVRAQPRQRIARHVRRDLRVGAVALLVVRAGVARQARHREAHERRPLRRRERASTHSAISAAASAGSQPSPSRRKRLPNDARLSRDVAARRLHARPSPRCRARCPRCRRASAARASWPS